MGGAHDHEPSRRAAAAGVQVIRNQASQTIGGQLIDAASGGAFAGTVTVYITKDAGTQAIGSVGSGLCTAEGNGYYTYRPSATETDGTLIAFTFIGTGAVPTTVQVNTITEEQQASVTSSSGSGTVTVRNLIIAAFRRLNVFNEGEDPTGASMNDAFDRFNDWVDSVCANDRLLIHRMTRTVWTLTATKGTIANPYTVGSGGDIAVDRPTIIDHVNYQNTAVSPTLELPLTPLTDDAWAAIPQKNLTSTLPTSWYYNPTFTTGYGSLYLWMVPSQSSLQGVLYAPHAVTRFGALNDSIALPPGYNRFLRDGLALELAPEWLGNLPIDPSLIQSYTEARDRLKTANFRMMDLSLDRAVLPQRGGYYSIYSDT